MGLAELHEEDKEKHLAVVASQDSILLVCTIEVDWQINWKMFPGAEAVQFLPDFLIEIFPDNQWLFDGVQYIGKLA
jgi:hypothetical protein